MILVFDDGSNGRRRWGPIKTRLPVETAVLSSLRIEQIAQLTADLLTCRQTLPDFQSGGLGKMLIQYGRLRVGKRFDRLVSQFMLENMGMRDVDITYH